MLNKMRLPLFIIAVLLQILVVLIEFGATLWLAPPDELANPGLGIKYMGLIDGLVLFTLLLIAAPLIVPHRIHGRFQGIATFLFSLLVLIVSVLMILTALGLLMLMVSLFLAVPFGTAIYFADFSTFEVRAAAATLAALMSLKLGFAFCLVLAHQRFLENKGLVLLILTSLLANIIVTFLQGFVPAFLVPITDSIAAVIAGILAAIWSLLFLIGSIPAIYKTLRVDRALR